MRILLLLKSVADSFASLVFSLRFSEMLKISRMYYLIEFLRRCAHNDFFKGESWCLNEGWILPCSLWLLQSTVTLNEITAISIVTMQRRRIGKKYLIIKGRIRPVSSSLDTCQSITPPVVLVSYVVAFHSSSLIQDNPNEIYLGDSYCQ